MTDAAGAGRLQTQLNGHLSMLSADAIQTVELTAEKRKQ